MMANGHSMTSIAAITASPTYHPRRGCGRLVAPRECDMVVLRRGVVVWRRLRRGLAWSRILAWSRGFVSVTLSAFISARLPPSRRHAGRGLGGGIGAEPAPKYL